MFNEHEFKNIHSLYILLKYESIGTKLAECKQIKWVCIVTDLKLSKIDCHSITLQNATPLPYF